jgi:hypothetical protein
MIKIARAPGKLQSAGKAAHILIKLIICFCQSFSLFDLYIANAKSPNPNVHKTIV